MAAGKNRLRKDFQLDVAKVKRVQKILGARTGTEAIERALDFVIVEHKKNRLTTEANERFVKSGIDIKDVYGKLSEDLV